MGFTMKQQMFVLLAQMVLCHGEPESALPTRSKVLAHAKRAFEVWALERPTYNVGPAFNCSEGMLCNDCHWTGSTFLLGVLDYHRESMDTRALSYARRWAQHYNYRICGERSVSAQQLRHNVNHQLSGAVYAELYRLDGNRMYLDSAARVLGAEIADASSVGLWSWVDLLHMAMSLYSRMGSTTSNVTYFEKQFANFNASVLAHADGQNRTFGFWNSSERLMYRDDRFLGSAVYWGRGNGWALAALVAALEFGAGGADPYYTTYLGLFKQLAARIAAVQSPDGAWRASLLDPIAFPEAEASATASFTYGLAWGVNNGLLPAAAFASTVTRAWAWLSTKALHVNGTVGYCQPGGDQPENNFGPTTTTNFCVGLFLRAASQVSRLRRCDGTQ